MSDFSGRIVEVTDLALDERHELEARRAAEQRRLAMEFHPLDRHQHDEEFELQLIEPRTWRCIAIRHSWAQMHRLIEDCRLVGLRRLLEQAGSCNLHRYERPADQRP